MWHVYIALIDNSLNILYLELIVNRVIHRQDKNRGEDTVLVGASAQFLMLFWDLTLVIPDTGAHVVSPYVTTFERTEVVLVSGVPDCYAAGYFLTLGDRFGATRTATISVA